jgi:hypothetical protein
MNNNHQVRRCAAGVGVAAGVAVAAAMLASASVARADTIDELLTQSEADMAQAAALFSGVDTSSLSAQQTSGIESVVSGLQNQGDLISQIQPLQDGLPVADQTSSLILGADQQLATASGDLLSSSNTFVNGIDAGDFPLFHASTFAGDLTGLEATAGLLYAELFQVVPAEFDAALAPLSVEFASGIGSDAGTTGAASASAASTDAVPQTLAATGSTPADLLGEGQTDLTDANTVLRGIDLTGKTSEISSIVTNEMEIIGTEVQIQDELGMLQTDVVDAQKQLSGLPGYDLVTQATNDLLTQGDQSVLNADDALLSGDQAAAAAISSGSGLPNPDDLLGSVLAPLGVIGADFAAFGDTFDAAFTSILAPF